MFKTPGNLDVCLLFNYSNVGFCQYTLSSAKKKKKTTKQKLAV